MTITNVIIMKRFEILQDLSKHDTKTHCWKNDAMPTDLLDEGLPQNFKSEKTVSVNRNKTRYACIRKSACTP